MTGTSTPLVGALYRRLPRQEIPITPTKWWVVIAAAVIAVATIALVVV